MLGPKLVSPAICLGCNENLQPNKRVENFYKCSKCEWPLCSEYCEKSKLHTAECNHLSKSTFKCPINYDASDKNRKESAYCTIVPLRCLLLKHDNPKGYGFLFILSSCSFLTLIRIRYKALLNLEDHLEERIKTPIYNVLKTNLVSFIRNILGRR